MKRFLLGIALLASASVSVHARQPDIVEELSRALQGQLEKLAPPLPGIPANSFAKCPQFFHGGTAPRVPGIERLAARELCYDAFAILHAGRSKTPVFVAERLNWAQLVDAGDEKRRDRFYAEARLPQSERAELADYKRSGYSRGHMAPAANMPTPQAMAQSFSLANMVPQAIKNNQQAWADIEQATRRYVMRAKGDVYVITGPVHADPVQTIGDGKVWVPRYLYKLVYDATTRRAWAHWIENTDAARAGPPISYAELVRRTGIDFIAGLHADSQAR